MNTGISGLRTLKGTTGIGTLFTQPSIGALYTPRPEIESKFGKAFYQVISDLFKIGVPIYADSYEESGGNDVSEQVLVGGIGSDDSLTGALTKVADNIVVNPRKWRIHGYTGFDTNTGVGHFMRGMIPLPLLTSMLNQFGKDALNNVFKDTIQYLAEARRPFKFNTKEGETVPCFFRNYNFKSKAENGNFIEMDLELQEFRFLSLTDSGNNQQASGGINSVMGVKKLGRCALKALNM